MPIDPSYVNSWIFDLDNTLYPPSTRLFEQVDQRMGAFIAGLLGCEHAAAREVQKRYFHDYGTTLAGLIEHHGVDPVTFLDYVHDVDMTALVAAPRLAPLLEKLPGRKLIYTNADAPYADRVMAALGIKAVFDGSYDIIAAEFVPKPDPAAMRSMIAHFGIDPACSVFVEDMARNLPPAHALGMQTVWLDTGGEWGGSERDPAVIDETASDVAEWLASVLARL